MIDLPKGQHIHKLLDEALERASAIHRSFTADMVSAVQRAMTALSAPVTAKGHLALMLSAARRHVLDLEKRTVGLIIGDEPISQQEMAGLVRIRLICAELLTILADALAESKLLNRQELNKLSRFAGS